MTNYMIQEKQWKKVLAIVLISCLLLVLLYGLWPYLNALLGSFILFIIFRPLYRWLVKRWKLKSGLAALLIILIVFVVVLVPVSFLASVLIKESQLVIANIREQSGLWGKLFQFLPQMDTAVLVEQISQAGSTAGRLFFGTLSAIGNQVIAYLLMFFLLYFLLTSDEEKLNRLVFELIPFSRDNTVKLQREFKKVTYTTLITSSLIALLQGSLLALGFWFFAVDAPVLWGLVAVIASFVPMIGTAVVWLPAVLLYFFQGNWGVAGGLLACGLIVSTIDNFIRPFMQRQVGQIHPFVSLLGVVIGLSIFGLVGLIIGPLFVSYFILMIKMFKEEYIAA